MSSNTHSTTNHLSVLVGLAVAVLGLLTCGKVDSIPTPLLPTHTPVPTPLLPTHTPVPTLYLTPVATNTPEMVATSTPGSIEVDSMPVDSFSISSSNHTTPEDVLREILVYSGGGPLGACGYCGEEYEHPTLLYGSTTHTEPHDWMVACTCGWEPGELVRVTLEFPDGRTMSETQESDWDEDWGEWSIGSGYRPELSDSPGVYTFTFRGESSEIVHTVYVERPLGPRLYRDWEEDRMVLCNFAPNENVRVLVYSPQPDARPDHCQLIGWQEHEVDSSGQLVLLVDTEDACGDWGCYITVVGDISGQVDFFSPGSFEYGYVLFPRYVVANTGGERLNVRGGPGDDHPVVAEVDSGTRMEVTGEPYSGAWESEVWWHVRLSDRTEGWVDDKYVKRIVE